MDNNVKTKGLYVTKGLFPLRFVNGEILAEILMVPKILIPQKNVGAPIMLLEQPIKNYLLLILTTVLY